MRLRSLLLYLALPSLLLLNTGCSSFLRPIIQTIQNMTGTNPKLQAKETDFSLSLKNKYSGPECEEVLLWEMHLNKKDKIKPENVARLEKRQMDTPGSERVGVLNEL